MSHTLFPLRKQRLQRSELAVPASNPAMIDKAAAGPADYVFLDLEDAVAPPEKERARRNCIQALNDIDWAAKGKTVSVRINGLDTHYMYRDVVDVMEQAGARVHTLLVPKVGVPVPKGGLAWSPEPAAYRARELGTGPWVVKAQVHAGGRGGGWKALPPVCSASSLPPNKPMWRARGCTACGSRLRQISPKSCILVWFWTGNRNGS